MQFDGDILPHGSHIAIVAGRGAYPLLCAKNMVTSGHEFSVIAVDDGVDAEWFRSLPKSRAVKIAIGQVSKLLSALKNFGVQFAIMAGQVKPKSLFHGMRPDFKAMLILAKLKERNAESIFGAIADEIAAIDVRLLDARSFMVDNLATIGSMSHGRNRISLTQLNFGVEMARNIAGLNIGQSVVVRRGTVVAVEDFAGTDDLIARVRKFSLSDAIFVKAAKLNQDFRFDVPTFGLQTLRNLQESHISCAALEAGKVIIFDKESVLREAKKCGIEIIGFE
jgi:DUF1009 family protein